MYVNFGRVPVFFFRRTSFYLPLSPTSGHCELHVAVIVYLCTHVWICVCVWVCFGLMPFGKMNDEFVSSDLRYLYRKIPREKRNPFGRIKGFSADRPLAKSWRDKTAANPISANRTNGEKNKDILSNIWESMCARKSAKRVLLGTWGKKPELVNCIVEKCNSFNQNVAFVTVVYDEMGSIRHVCVFDIRTRRTSLLLQRCVRTNYLHSIIYCGQNRFR